MYNKKSQITVFILVGIVLIFSFLFLYYISSLVQQERGFVTSTQTTLKNSLLNSYITKCLQRTATDGLALIGNQGGKIFFASTDQKITYLGNNILVGIPNKALPPDIIIPFPFKQENILFPYFGRDKISSLCDSEGPNARNEKFQPCLSYSKKDSIQSQLNMYIKDKIAECSKLDTLFEGITYQNPKVETIIGKENILFSLEYPINYTIETQIFQLNDFNQELPVRLMKFHEFIKELVKKEISYPEFNIQDDYKYLTQYYEGFNIKTIANIVPNQINGDLIEIIDFNSIIDGHAYSFKLIRENRAPAFLDIDVIVTDNRVEITPIVFDPDEDTLKMSIDNTAFKELDGTFYMQPILLSSGTHFVKITIEDEFGLKSQQSISFKI